LSNKYYVLTFKKFFKNITGIGEMDLSGSGQGLVMGSINHNNEFSGSI